MRNKPSFLLLILTIFQFSCNSEQKIEAYNLTPNLEAKVKIAIKSNQKIKLQLCEMVPFIWDKIIVIPPYTDAEKIRSYNLHNSKFIERNMIDSLFDEGKCLLLYIQDDTIVRYSFVPRTPLDFNYINNDDSIKTLSKKLVCHELYINKVNNTTKLWR